MKTLVFLLLFLPSIPRDRSKAPPPAGVSPMAWRQFLRAHELRQAEPDYGKLSHDELWRQIWREEKQNAPVVKGKK